MNQNLTIIMVIISFVFLIVLFIKEKKENKKIEEIIIKIEDLLYRYHNYKNKKLYQTLNTEDSIYILFPEYFHIILRMIENNKSLEEMNIEFEKKSEEMYDLAQKIFDLSDDRTREIFNIISDFIIAYFYYMYLLFYNYTNEVGYDDKVINDCEKNLAKIYLTMKKYDLLEFLRLQKEYI